MTSLIEKWRLRHAYPDVLATWAASVGPEARALAFNAIAQDPRVLRRASRSQAIKMAAQAEDFVQSLAEPSAAHSDTWRAATLLVQQSIDAWRRSQKAYAHCTEGWSAPMEAPIVHTETNDPWEIAWRNFPAVDDATGKLATRLLHEFGSSLLKRARKPWDYVIILAVLRYSARMLRGDLSECEASDTSASAIADILTVQSYAEETGLSPMLVGYTGRGKLAAQALGLWRDARTLRNAVQEAGTGGEERAQAWQHAMDFHAFGLVALDHAVLLDLPLEDAYELAAAAIRQSEAAMQAPGSVEMPLLPADSASPPAVVRLHARACLPPRQKD